MIPEKLKIVANAVGVRVRYESDRHAKQERMFGLHKSYFSPAEQAITIVHYPLSCPEVPCSVVLAHELGHVFCYLHYTKKYSQNLVGSRMCASIFATNEQYQEIVNDEANAWLAARHLLSRFSFTAWETFEEIHNIGFMSYLKELDVRRRLG